MHGECVTDVRVAASSLSAIATAVGSHPGTGDRWLDPKEQLRGFSPDGIDHSHPYLRPGAGR